jgi:hypothetical protein
MNRERKYLGVGYNPHNLSSRFNDSTNNARVRYYGNGTDINNFTIDAKGHTIGTGDHYIAGQYSDWYPFEGGNNTPPFDRDWQDLGANITRWGNIRASGSCTIKTKPNKQYTVQQNCWWPANPCCSIIEEDMN